MASLFALTVKQPWGHFIANCGKTVENRTWATDRRGLLAIHAGAYSGWDKAAETSPVALRAWQEWATVPATGELATPLTRAAAYSYFKFGAVIAVAELHDCHHATWCERLSPDHHWCSPWARPDGFHWELADVRPLTEPVPCKGKLGLWSLPEDVEAAVRAQLEVPGA